MRAHRARQGAGRDAVGAVEPLGPRGLGDGVGDGAVDAAVERVGDELALVREWRTIAAAAASFIPVEIVRAPQESVPRRIPGKREDVVDRGAVGGERGAGAQRGLRLDLGVRVGQREDRLSLADHLGADQPRPPGRRDDDVGAGHDGREVGDLDAVGVGGLWASGSGSVASDGLRPGVPGQARDAEAGRAEPDLPDRLVGERPPELRARAGDRGQRGDRRAVHVVVHDRDVERLDEPFLDLEALRDLDVLEVDARRSSARCRARRGRTRRDASGR